MPEPTPPMTNEVFLSHKHPLQRRRFALALFFALILFPLIGVGLVAGTIVLVVPLFALLIWMTGRMLYAKFMGNCILVSELNYPRINTIGEDLKAVIGYNKPVNIFVYEQGNFNAYLFKFFFYRRAVFLNSELLEAGVSDDELRWLIGRFIGYLKARRQAGFWGWTIRAAQQLGFFNLFLLPYERALVYSGDRIALAVINGDISTAVAAMQKLMVGRQLGYSVNPSGMVDQHRKVKGSFFAFLARLAMHFPHMTARYVDLIDFAKQRYPAQYSRFEAENPGLPADLPQLAALPDVPSTGPVKDPIFLSLVGAAAVVALMTIFTIKVVIPRLNHPAPSYDIPTDYTPTSDDTSPTTTPGPADTTPVSDTSSVAPASGVQTFTSSDGHFSISFPVTPTQTSKSVALQGSDSTTLYEFVAGDENVSYMVMYSDYPSQYIGDDAQTFLQGRRDGSLQAVSGTIATDEAINLNGVPGRAFTFTDANGVSYSVHDFLDGQRFYQVIVAVSKGSSADHQDEFINSFKIL